MPVSSVSLRSSMITAGTKAGVEMFQLEEVCHEQILSVLGSGIITSN